MWNRIKSTGNPRTTPAAFRNRSRAEDKQTRCYDSKNYPISIAQVNYMSCRFSDTLPKYKRTKTEWRQLSIMLFPFSTTLTEKLYMGGQASSKMGNQYADSDRTKGHKT
jgi:hypothetical protein